MSELNVGFAPGLQLRALPLRTAHTFISKLISYVQSKTFIPVCAFIRTHRSEDSGANGEDAESGSEGSSEDEDEGEMTALFDIRLATNCWQEFDLEPLCVGGVLSDGLDGSRRRRSSTSIAAAGAAEAAAGDTSTTALVASPPPADMTTAKAVLNILESWTADPRRIGLVHSWIMEVSRLGTVVQYYAH